MVCPFQIALYLSFCSSLILLATLVCSQGFLPLPYGGLMWHSVPLGIWAFNNSPSIREANSIPFRRGPSYLIFMLFLIIKYVILSHLRPKQMNSIHLIVLSVDHASKSLNSSRVVNIYRKRMHNGRMSQRLRYPFLKSQCDT